MLRWGSGGVVFGLLDFAGEGRDGRGLVGNGLSEGDDSQIGFLQASGDGEEGVSDYPNHVLGRRFGA